MVSLQGVRTELSLGEGFDRALVYDLIYLATMNRHVFSFKNSCRYPGKCLTSVASRLVLLVVVVMTCVSSAMADDLISDQVTRQKVVDNGGTGRYKAIVVSEKTLPDFTVYRPRSVQGAARREGALPILIWCNGACSGSSMGYERMLNEIASHGYLVVGIGAFKMTDNEREDGGSSEKMVVDAINWLVKQERMASSQYYKAIDVRNIALAGHSCGGAQAIANCANARVKTLLIMNAGMGGMSMGGASPQTLNQLHCPLIYMTGGPDDVAYGNAQTDFGKISKVPVTWADLPTAGHGGTYWNQGGGEFGTVALKWLDWRLKGYGQNARLFLKPELKAFRSWTISNRNYPDTDCDAPFLPFATTTETVFPHSELDDTFAFGADVTSLTKMVQNGRIFYNREGTRGSLMSVLQEEGMNSIRLQVLVNPADDVASITSVRTLCQQAKNLGLSIMLDLNFSDVWANAGIQEKPATWARYDIDRLEKMVYSHTLNVMRRVATTGADIRWVQIGNEVDNGMLWDEGRMDSSSTNFVKFINSAYRAVKEAAPEAQAVLHVSECLTEANLTQYFDTLVAAGAQWDAIGLSAYPTFSTLSRTTFISRVAANISMLKERYGKPVMVVETGYYNDRPLEANNFLCDFMTAIIDAGGSGLFYWEPAMKDDYALGAWNILDNKPSIALDAFLGLRHKEYTEPVSIAANEVQNQCVKLDGHTLSVNSSAGIRQIRIFTLSGQLLAEHEVNGNTEATVVLDSSLTRRLLLVQVTTGKGMTTQYIRIK